MKSVHTASDEVQALMLQGILEEAGIPVLLRSRQLPGYGEVLERATGIWGDLLVPDDREAEARTLVVEYLASLRGARRRAGLRSAQSGRHIGDRATRPAAATASPTDRSAEADVDEAGSGLGGIVVPIPTLFDEQGRVDEAANVRHIEWLLEHGVHGIFALGTTGEFTSLSPEERRAFARLVVQTVRGRVPVLIGCSSPWTDEAIGYAEYAEEIGADGVVSVLPYYWIPPDRSIYEHFRLLAISTHLPVYIYNFPALTGRSIPPQLVARLAADHANIAGIKDTVDSVAHIHEILSLVRPIRPDFCVLCGMGWHLLNTVIMGGDGAVPGEANFSPDPAVRIYTAVASGRVNEAAEQARAVAGLPELFELDAPAFVVIKEAMVLAGLVPHATTRPPALPLTEDERHRLRRALESLGVAR
jgi:dihydrodipicolinate synthase/N-acetylneuraminate lyase